MGEGENSSDHGEVEGTSDVAGEPSLASDGEGGDGNSGINALANAQGEEEIITSDTGIASDETADLDAFLLAALDAGTAQIGATADIVADTGEIPAAPLGRDPEDETRDESAQ